MPFPVDIEFVRVAEQALDAELPAAYKAAMLIDNGGEVTADDDVWNLYPIEDTSDRKWLSRTCNHVIRETQQLAAWPTFPSHALAIAGNGTGDQLVLLKQGRSYEDRAWLWQHDTGALTPVADDFSGLRDR